MTKTSTRKRTSVRAARPIRRRADNRASFPFSPPGALEVIRPNEPDRPGAVLYVRMDRTMHRALKLAAATRETDISTIVNRLIAFYLTNDPFALSIVHAKPVARAAKNGNGAAPAAAPAA